MPKLTRKPQPLQDETTEPDQMDLPAKYFGWMKKPFVQLLDDGTAYIYDMADYGILEAEVIGDD